MIRRAPKLKSMNENQFFNADKLCAPTACAPNTQSPDNDAGIPSESIPSSKAKVIRS
jgi:hypothetical protein